MVGFRSTKSAMKPTRSCGETMAVSYLPWSTSRRRRESAGLTEPALHRGLPVLRRRAGRRRELHAMGSVRCPRLGGGAYGSGQYSTRREIMPLSTVKNETASAD